MSADAGVSGRDAGLGATDAGVGVAEAEVSAARPGVSPYDSGVGAADGGRLIVASNRLPVVLTHEPDGDWNLEPGSGGLVTAMRPILERSRGVWVGWPGVPEGALPEPGRVLEEVTRHLPYGVRPVPLTQTERDAFYRGMSNEVIWPLFHDLQSHCHFDPSYWGVYEAVNAKFARAILDAAQPGDLVWVHDYHLMRTARSLRELGHEEAVGFFLHIPFPPPDLFVKLPWRMEILQGLLAFDLVGFQAERDRRNFLDCVRALVPRAAVRPDADQTRVEAEGRSVRVGVFPVSIDFAAFERDAASPEVVELAERLRRNLDAERLILGVDRQDYSKGIPHKLGAFRRALQRHPELRGRVRLAQLVVPSRENVPKYRELKSAIDRLVGEINGDFTRRGWVPLHFEYGSWDRRELLAWYRAADVALVTPLKDGMNLVSKEYCACRTEERGVLILSEFAGAADELAEGALLVNPYDVERAAETIVRALRMPVEEQTSRMRHLRERIRSADIFRWQEEFLGALRRARETADAGGGGGDAAAEPVAPG